MDQKEEDLKYLQEMCDKANNEPLSKGEVEQITEAFRTNVDDPKAAEFVIRIADVQIERYTEEKDDGKNFGEIDIVGLGRLTHEVAGKVTDDQLLYSAERTEIYLAAALINEERFHEFQILKREGFDPKMSCCDHDYSNMCLLDKVNTLSGAKYLEFNNLIPDDYFTHYNPGYDLPPLCRASDEQIDFYIAHGANVNAVNEYEETVLDMMLLPRDGMESHSVESARKIYEAGGKSTFTDEKDAEWLINRFVEASSDYKTVAGGKTNELTVNYGKNAIKNCLDNIAFFIEKGIMPRPKNLGRLFSHREWFEQYPDTMKKIFSEGVDIQKKLEELKVKAEQKDNGEDLLEEKQKEIKLAYRNGGFRVRRRNKDGESVEEKFFNAGKMSMGKTGDSLTGKISDEQRKVGQNQAEAAYKFMREHSKENRK